MKGPNIDHGKFWRERFFGGGGIGWCSTEYVCSECADFEPHARAQRSGRGLLIIVTLFGNPDTEKMNRN